MAACGARGREFGRISQARTLESEVRPLSDKYQRPKKLAPWREAERYFKRHRDTKKTIPLRTPMLSQMLYNDETGSVNWKRPQSDIIVIDDSGPVDWDKACGKANP